MAVQTLNTLKNWFRTGLKPSQQQFWDWLDSFRHKNDKVPVADVEGIDELLLAKASQDVLDNHLTDLNAHPQLLVKSRIIPVGQMLVFKVAPNENEAEKEPGDFCMGIVENEFINANYLGGDESLSSSYGDSND
jgi:hypothetical protein